MKLNKAVISVIVLSGFLFACAPTRRIPEGKYLLVSNKIITDTTILGKERFEKYLKQKTNRKVLGFIRFHLGLYNLGSSSDSSKFKSWLRSIGDR